MTCAECLSQLATSSLREMPADSAVMQHCATCPDCSRLTTLLREREYNAANVLNNLPPTSNPITLAESSVRLAQRRRVGRVVVMVSGAALVATIWVTAVTMILPVARRSEIVANSPLRTETITLRCLSPEQAADIINPYVRSRGSGYYMPNSRISAITVRGTADEVAKSRNLIGSFESDPSAACRSTPFGMLKKLGEEDASNDGGRGMFHRPGEGTSNDATPAVAGKATTAPKK